VLERLDVGVGEDLVLLVLAADVLGHRLGGAGRAAELVRRRLVLALHTVDDDEPEHDRDDRRHVGADHDLVAEQELLRVDRGHATDPPRARSRTRTRRRRAWARAWRAPPRT